MLEHFVFHAEAEICIGQRGHAVYVVMTIPFWNCLLHLWQTPALHELAMKTSVYIQCCMRFACIDASQLSTLNRSVRARVVYSAMWQFQVHAVIVLVAQVMLSS